MSGLKTSKYTRFRVDDVGPDHLGACVTYLSPLLKVLQSVRVSMSDSDAIKFDIVDGDSNGRVFSIGIKTNPTHTVHHLEQILRVLSQASPTTPLDVTLGRTNQPEEWESPGPPWNLELPESVFETCSGLRTLWVGQCVNIDSILDFLAAPKEDSRGIWTWPCPNLSKFY